MFDRSRTLFRCCRLAAGVLIVLAAGMLTSISLARSSLGAAAAYYYYSTTSTTSTTTTTPAPVPTTLVLSPAAATNTVGTSHTVTATVNDQFGDPFQGVVVRFTVTGSVTTSGNCTTDAAGQCTFTYTGPSLPGADLITAFADTNGDGTLDAGEPTGTATKAWILPTSTPGQVTGGGQIV